MRLTPVNPKHLPTECVHGAGAPVKCRTCIDMAVIAQERAIADYQAEQCRRAQEPPTPRPPSAFRQYMEATYPNEPESRWPRLTLRDPRAKELSIATR